VELTLYCVEWHAKIHGSFGNAIRFLASGCCWLYFDSLSVSFSSLEPGKHPNAGDGLWGTENEVPSFLYAMPLEANRVFLEETCLVAKPALPFATLKRRLERRLMAMGIKVMSTLYVEESLFSLCGADVNHIYM
jgi:Lycopene cyclase protein